MSPPDFLIRDILNARPNFFAGRLISPSLSEIMFEEINHILRYPACDMYTVGNMGYRDFIFGETGPERLPHGMCDMHVETAD